MKKKLGMAAALIIMLLLTWTGLTYAVAPRAYVTYTGQTGTTVSARVYFEDPGGFNDVRATATMTASGSDLNWAGAAPLTVNTAGGALKYVNLSMNKYMNYYLRIASVAEATYVRLFPVDTTTTYGTNREYNDYAHGNFRPDTPMCGGCHSTHSALKAQLLKKASYYELCMLCHSNANTQSKYDVESGMTAVAGSQKPSLAGPFVKQVGLPAISLHNANDTLSLTANDVPGSDVLSGTKKLSLTCVSCHNGHGGTDDNYRLLKKSIYADDNKSLVTNSIDFDAYAITASATSGEELFMVRGNSEFCAACHLDYDDGNAWVAGGVYGSNVPAPGPGVARYRHPVSVGSVVYSVYGVNGLKNPSFEPAAGDLLPLQYTPDQALKTDKRTGVVCSTCHFAHGSTKSFNVQDTVYDGKYMLRLDNYGVCQSCHKK